MDERVIKSREETKRLVFIFHGYGANKEDMFSIGEAFSEVLPDAEIHMPDGFDPCNDGFGYCWFPLNSNNVAIWGDDLRNYAEPKIMAYIDKIKDEKHLQYSDIILSGFSQGAMVAISLGVGYGMKAVVSFSGIILHPDQYLNERDTKVLLCHGENDDILHHSLMQMTDEALKSANIDTKAVLDENIGHSISSYLLNQAVDFLKSL